MKQALKLSYLYSALSVVLGPALVFLSARHPSGWDCSDPTWDQGGVYVPMKAREAIYDHQALPMLVGAYLMLAIGIGIAGYLIYKAKQNKKYKPIVVPLFLMLFIFLGYLAMIMLASSPWC